MRAIDTNIIVRFITGDHPIQSAQARALLASEDVFVCATVLLETEWVLRSVYNYDRPILARALRAYAGLPHVRIEYAERVAAALGWMEAGMDFADALHLVSVAGCDGFVSFDRDLAKLARKLDVGKVQAP